MEEGGLAGLDVRGTRGEWGGGGEIRALANNIQRLIPIGEKSSVVPGTLRG